VASRGRRGERFAGGDAGPACQPGRFDRPRRRLRAGLVQLLFALAWLGLGLLLPRVTAAPTVASSRVTDALIGVGFGVLGLVSIIFSLLFLVVQWAFSSLSPRLNLFRDDPIVWRTFGLAVGVFVFSVTAALVIGNDPEVSVIVPAAEVAGVLAALALIRTLQVKAFASIQLAPTLSAIAAQGRGVLDDLYPRPGPDGRPPGAPLPPLRRAVTWPNGQAISQQLDLHRLLDAAAGGAVIVLRARIGDTVQEGAVVADLHGGDASDTAVLAGLVTGPERTFHQDPLLAFRLLADIGLRALSPAVNDPATAVQVLDTIQDLPMPLVTRDLDTPEITDAAGAVRWCWRSRPGMTTCGSPWTISSNPVPGLPWCCCRPRPCSPACSKPRRTAGPRSPGGCTAPRSSRPATSRRFGAMRPKLTDTGGKPRQVLATRG
jgi:hypothetical protein